MNTEDLKKATELIKAYKELYDKFVGLAGIGEYVHITLSEFMKVFAFFDIDERGASCGNFKLSTEYNGVTVMCIASYNEMLKYKKTKQYLRGLLDEKEKF